jgi:hypothetical protein
MKVLKKRWSDISSKITSIVPDQSDDIFISCISYEPRTIAILEKLDKKYKAEIGVFIINTPFENYENVQENLKKCHRIIEKGNNFFTVLQITSALENPIKVITELERIIQQNFEHKSYLSVTIDVSTIPRGELLTILYYLRKHNKIQSIRILYVSPEKYGDWLSEGYAGSTIPPFFEGTKCFDKKTALLILTGFELSRPLGLIEDLEPSLIIFGSPEPGTAAVFLKQSQVIVEKLKTIRKINFEYYKIPANNAVNAKNQIQSIIKKYSQDYDFYVSVLGPKIELIGAYLAYEEKPTFRMIYPMPRLYNIGNYSSGCLEIFEFLLP